ncbi:benzoate 4-monooxygenase [Alternaria rosae]|uniref:benzoate 4-monooxygenase n=1 Tax=Alternaria rosae TaxID=1187941 RepID=UPI001E8E031A|nr:benzoate 4-monooxygenase [Alternaria rosae]KAH6857449.1 benzoate 4-monooxygenase [Alternaria rosae]
MRFPITFAAGVVLHATVFARHREWDRHSANILISACVLFVAAVIAVAIIRDTSWISSFASVSVVTASFVSGLLSSMTVYRLLLHPLRSFPGPRAARITSLWVIKRNFPGLNLYVKMRSLHDRHGDFVRIRPREISICHPDAIADVHGPRNKITKGEFYDQTYPFHTVQFIRNPNLHKKQRRHWDIAFNSAALQGYVPRLTRHYQITASILASHAVSRKPIDASSTFLDLFFDVISDLTFGQSFDTQTTKQRSPIVLGFLRRQKALGFALLNMPLLHLSRNLRLSVKKQKSWEGWYDQALNARSKMIIPTADIYTYLSQSEGFRGNALSEAKLAIVAGADTNAITMSNTCYLLCRHPEYQEKLYDELSDLKSLFLNDRDLMDKPYLIGIINEALRLHPPVPSGLQRVTPAEGAVIAGRYIPGYMNVTTPTYALHRDSRAFVQPNEFIPERWYSRPDLILRRNAFVPFGYGAYSCAGKPLAMLQLRMVLAMISQRFTMSFAPGQEDLCQYFVDHQADCFTLHLEPLPLIFERRDV